MKNFSKIPSAPGIYLFFNFGKELIYVGKASLLKSRVRSYFVGKKSPRPIEEMIHEVAGVKWIATDSLLEAVILEGEYIKKFQPLYNIKWRDDKSWNYIVITKDKYPRVETAREHELKLNGAAGFLRVFGPFPGLNTKEALRILRKIFLFSDCKPGIGKPCFNYQLGQCLGVCVGEITREDYLKKVIRPLVLFLQGKKSAVIKNFIKQMKTASKAENFEEAARLRNQIRALQKIQDAALLNKNFLEINFPKQKFRIEGYDISNIMGTSAVGSMVVFENGEAVKNEYRKFRIKTVFGADDVGMLKEVIARRLKHAEWPMPDLILVDGGRGQVNAALSVLKNTGISIGVIGLAKGPSRKRNDIVNGSALRPIELNKLLPVLINVRDEAHRFAIVYHKVLRSKKFLDSH